MSRTAAGRLPRASFRQDLYHRAHLLSRGQLAMRAVVAVALIYVFMAFCLALYVTVRRDARLYAAPVTPDLSTIGASDWIVGLLVTMTFLAALIAPALIGARISLIVFVGVFVRVLRAARAFRAAVFIGRSQAATTPLARSEAVRLLVFGCLWAVYATTVYVVVVSVTIAELGARSLFLLPIAGIAAALAASLTLRVSASVPGGDVVSVARAYFSLQPAELPRPSIHPIPACAVCDGERAERALWRRMLRAAGAACIVAGGRGIRWLTGRSAWAAYAVAHRGIVAPIAVGLVWTLLLELARMSVLQAVWNSTLLLALLILYAALRGHSRTLFDALSTAETGRHTAILTGALGLVALLIFNVQWVRATVHLLSSFAAGIGAGFDETQAVFLVFFSEGASALLLWRAATLILRRNAPPRLRATARGILLPLCALVAGTFDAGFAVLVILATAGWLGASSRPWREEWQSTREAQPLAGQSSPPDGTS